MQEFLFQVAIEIAGLLLLLLVAVACVRWARRASFDRQKRCVRCGYPRGDDPAAPCAECGHAPIVGARARGLPTWRWPALWVAGACAGGAAILGVRLVHRPHFYPRNITLNATWNTDYRPSPSESNIFIANYQGSGWMMGYDVYFRGPSAARDRIELEYLNFSMMRGSDMATEAFLSLHRVGDRWTVTKWSPPQPDGATPAVGDAVDEADLARWLFAQRFPRGSDPPERARRSAHWLMGDPGLRDRAFGPGPLSEAAGDRFEQMKMTYHGRPGSDPGGAITPLWNAVRWSVTALVAIALGGWALQLLVRGERSRRLVRDARG